VLALVALPILLFVVWFPAWIAHHASIARPSFRWLRNVVIAEVAAVLVLAVIGAVYENVSAKRARAQHPPPGKLIDIGGYRLHLDCAGEGAPTVVLIYGMAGSYLDWYRVQPELAKTTRVCSYDRAGYGWSDASPKPRVPSAISEELHTLLHNAGEKPPFVLVGHSLGAFDALMYAHRFPAEVGGLILVDGAHPDSNISFAWRERMWMRFLQFTAPFGLPRWRKWCLQGPAEIAGLKSAFNCQPRVFAANYGLRAAYPQAAEEVRRLGPVAGAPLVVISRDPNRPGASPSAEQRWTHFQNELATLSPDRRHVVASGSGHGIPLDRPDVIVAEVQSMLKSLRPILPVGNPK
jgi:pimeloyl-ACP methyl ester carboxylesterase